MIKCQHCGKFVNIGSNDPCPHCNKKGRAIYEHLSDGFNSHDVMVTTLEQKKEIISHKKLFNGIILTLVISIVAYFLTGLRGIIIGFLLSLIVFLRGPEFRKTIIKIFTDVTK
jgi:ABC-type amino acid transport system permease subunit